MNLELAHLQVFRAVATEKSFTRAAEKLFRTQPGVSQIIQSLEQEVGAPLFLRQGRTSALTQVGRVLLEHTEQVFDVLDQAKSRIQGMGRLQEGALTISTSDTTAFYLLPKVLEKFRRQYPGVEVCIRSKPSPMAGEQVITREADLGIVTLPVDHPDLVAEPLIIREDVAICSAGHELAGSPSITFEKLAHYPMVLLDLGSSTRHYIDQRFLKEGLIPNIIMEMGSIEVIKKLVELDFGVSIVPMISIIDEVKNTRLAALRILKKKECRWLGIIYRDGKYISPAARVFMDMLKEEFGGHSEA